MDMLTRYLHSSTAWCDYFPEANPTNLNSQTYDSRQTFSSTSVYVSNSLFISITSTGDGGALYFTSMAYFLAESTSFFSCKTSSAGGAIYFEHTNSGQCVLHEVCGYDCCTTADTRFQFACIRVNSAVSSKNYFNYSSFTRCVNKGSSSWYTIYFIYGKICCPSVNISLNECIGRSGIYCQPSATCSLTYSSFADNIANGHTCIRFSMSDANYEIKSCNILRNTQGDLSSEGTIYTVGNTTIQDSCILGNTANYIFFVNTQTHTFTLSNCTVDSTSNNRNLKTQNTVTKSFILALNHISTQNCHSGYDAVGTLNPITPHTEKRIHCCTCGIIFYQTQLRDFISLFSAFYFLE
jgi:hypothetical protein